VFAQGIKRKERIVDVLDVDPGTLLVAGVGAAVLGSPEARHAIGSGVGWVAGTAWRLTRPVVMPVVDAGRDMAGDVRESATSHNGESSAPTAARAGRTRRPAGATTT
jgi:hypothetical protein